MERKWLVRWLYANALLHLAAGQALPWIADAAALDWYHAVLGPSAQHARQAWWLALFGPTLQCIGLWMLALVWFGDKRHEPAAWLWLAAGLLLWGPQDIMVSLRSDVWPNVWLDLATLTTLLPPACRLYLLDRPARPQGQIRGQV